jgi:hypothetical protein
MFSGMLFASRVRCEERAGQRSLMCPQGITVQIRS